MIILTLTLKDLTVNIYLATSLKIQRKVATAEVFPCIINLILVNLFLLLTKTKAGIIWVKVDAEVLSTNIPSFICHCYIPPRMSTVLNDDIDIFELLEIDFVNFCNQGNIYMSGDTNSRTSDHVDYLDTNAYLNRETLQDESTIPVRSNLDPIIDMYGRKLLDLCKSTGLLIVNGRHSHDQFGEYTFCGRNGLSTVVYLLTTIDNFTNISLFEILQFNEFSDRAPIHFCLKSNMRHNNSNKSPDKPSSPHTKWDKSKFPRFYDELAADETILNQLRLSLVDNVDIDHVVQSFTTLMNEKARHVFDRVVTHTCTHRNTKPKQKWFNADCLNKRKQFKQVRNTFVRDKSETNRRNFVKARSAYNKTKQQAKLKFKRQEGERINNLAKTDSKGFWKHIKQSIGSSKVNADDLKLEDLLHHFQNLFGQDDNQEPVTDENLPQSDLYPEFFDTEITEDELRSAVFSQNNGKSPGLDELPAEIFKVSYNLISPILLTLYNKMYSTGTYPQSWGNGIIAPIYKKGDPNNAENYRGITLINILAKIYSQILLNRLTKWSTLNETLNKNQFGFQKGKSIIDCIFILRAIVTKVLSTGGKLYCAFIDYERCFDKIN